jgi:hypothetical protein
MTSMDGQPALVRQTSHTVLGGKSGPKSADETILGNPRNHPETEPEYVLRP